MYFIFITLEDRIKRNSDKKYYFLIKHYTGGANIAESFLAEKFGDIGTFGNMGKKKFWLKK